MASGLVWHQSSLVPVDAVWRFYPHSMPPIVEFSTLKVYRQLGVALIIVGYVAFYLFSRYINPSDFLCLTRVLRFFPAFMIGYLCAKLQAAWLLPGWSFVFLPIAVSVLLVCICYRIPGPYFICELLVNICAYTICVALLVILTKIPVNDGVRRVVIVVEQLSMGIYIFNQIAMGLR